MKFISRKCSSIVNRVSLMDHMTERGWWDLPAPIRYRIMRWVAMPYTTELLAVMAAERRCMAWHQERFRHKTRETLVSVSPPMTRWKLPVTEFSPQRILYRIRQEREIVFMLDWV